MKNYTNCSGLLHDYLDKETGFIQSICWKCGYYEDNSPAFRLLPESFKSLFRDNPIHFMRKFAINRKETRITLPTRKQNLL